jgi:integrase
MIYKHGLRVSEACDLRWDDIDLAARAIVIRSLKGSPNKKGSGCGTLKVIGVIACEGKDSRTRLLSPDIPEWLRRRIGRWRERKPNVPRVFHTGNSLARQSAQASQFIPFKVMGAIPCIPFPIHAHTCRLAVANSSTFAISALSLRGNMECCLYPLVLESGGQKLGMHARRAGAS